MFTCGTCGKPRALGDLSAEPSVLQCLFYFILLLESHDYRATSKLTETHGRDKSSGGQFSSSMVTSVRIGIAGELVR